MSQKALVHTDAFIEHWAEVFLDSDMHRRLGIEFEQFLTSPKIYCYALAAESEDSKETAERIAHETFEPLLPEQQAVAERVNADATTAALKRLETGTQTEADMPVIRDALERSAAGRRILADRLSESSHRRVSA